MRTMQRTATAIGLLTLAALGGWMLTQTDSSHENDTTSAAVSTNDAGAQLFYSCPMHPQIHEQHPGNCPICGMKLVERREQTTETKGAASTTEQSDRKVLYWYDPMHPETHFDK